MIQVGKRYVNTTDIMQLYYTSSITDNCLNEIGTLAKGDVCVLLEIVELSCYSNSIDLKYLHRMELLAGSGQANNIQATFSSRWRIAPNESKTTTTKN
jgi:hypothetical protein